MDLWVEYNLPAMFTRRSSPTDNMTQLSLRSFQKRTFLLDRSELRSSNLNAGKQISFFSGEIFAFK